MSLMNWSRRWLARVGLGRRKQSPRKGRPLPALELLEDRSLPSSFTLAAVSTVTLSSNSAHTPLADVMHSGSKHGGGGGPGDPSSGGL
jgi:hypothetical protein